MKTKQMSFLADSSHSHTVGYQRLCQILLVLLALGVVGCSKRYDDMPAYLPFDISSDKNDSVGRFKTSYLIQQIDDYYRGTNPGPLGITTFVNVDDLYSSSTFGRMLSEQVMSELTMRGFDVMELRQADALRFMSKEGEFGLSRELGAVKKSRELGGIVVGTYAVSPDRVYLNARLLDPRSSMVLSAGSVEMSKTTEIAKLLRGGGSPQVLERIPVKHMGFAQMPMALTPGGMQPYDMEESGPPTMKQVQPSFTR